MIDYKSFKAPGLWAWLIRWTRHSKRGLILAVNGRRNWGDPWNRREQRTSFKH